MPHKPVDPSSLPPWKRKAPPGKSRPLSTQQIEAARMRAAQAGRRYPNLVDNMWRATCQVAWRTPGQTPFHDRKPLPTRTYR